MVHTVAHITLAFLTLVLDAAMMGIVLPHLINQDSWIAFGLAIAIGFILFMFNGLILSVVIRYVEKTRKKPASRRRTRR